MFLNTSCTFSNNSIGATEFHEEENSLTIALENASFLRTFSPGALDEEVLRFPSAFEFPARTKKKVYKPQRHCKLVHTLTLLYKRKSLYTRVQTRTKNYNLFLGLFIFKDTGLSLVNLHAQTQA